MPKKNKILKEKDIAEVRGGWRFLNDEQEYDYNHDIHYGCGGHIKYHNNIVHKCICEKCGLKNYWYDDFFTFQHTGEGPFFVPHLLHKKRM